MRSSNDILDDAAALRSRLDEDGYLYFEHLLDVERVRELRRAMLRVTRDLGWTEQSTMPLSQRCVVPPLREEFAEFIAGYQEIQKLQSFHELAHDPALMSMMRSVLGETAFPHPLKIARLAFPDHFEASTPPHQDYPNNQGTQNLTATWIPVSDLPSQMGGLAILRGSHRYGVLPMEGHVGAGNRAAIIPPEMAEECRWVTTDYEMGDVLVFPSTTVHASLHNASEFFLRLSVDFRFQLEGQALTPGCLEPHFQRLSWEEIYAGWDDTTHQYYWRDLDYEVVPFEDMPIEGSDGSSELDPKAVGEIVRYEQRVKARTERRMEILGRRLEGWDTSADTLTEV